MAPLGILPFIAAAKTSPYKIEQSLRFDGSSKLERTNSNDGASRSFTLSYWIKKTYLGDNNNSIIGSMDSGSNWSYISYGESSSDPDQLIARSNGSQSGYSNGYVFNATRKHRDPSAWQHHFLVVDKTAGTSKAYINGVLDDGGTYGGTRSSNGWTLNGTVAAVRIGAHAQTGSSNYLNGYLAEFYFVDGTAMDETDFGEFDDFGVWKPIKPSISSYGTNGYYLKFDPTATNGVGHDHSGNGNNWTASGFTTSGTGTDVMSDTPTTNWCTLNPLDKYNNSAVVAQNGNLEFAQGGAAWWAMRASFGVTSGKWYWEVKNISGLYQAPGLGNSDADLNGYASEPNTWLYVNSGQLNTDGTLNSAASWGGNSHTTNDIVGVAFDADNGNLWFSKNGTWQGDASPNPGTDTDPAVTGLTNGPYFPYFVQYQTTTEVNFGQRDFAYTPPTGFKALNTSNLPTPTIKDGSEYFAALVGPGDTETAWSETNQAVSVSGGQLNNYDGLANTEHLLGRTDTKYPPIDFIRSLREIKLDGYDDWYLGSKYEMEVIYYNLKPTTDNNTTTASSQDNAYSVPQRTTANYTASIPSQTSVTAFQSGGAQAFDSETSTAQTYYTSSAPSTTASNSKSFTDQGIDAGYNYNSAQKYSEVGITRAIRRVAYTGSEPSLGAAYGGGYYAGLYSLNGDGTATHALIVSDKANGENTGMKDLVQQKFSSGLYWIKDRQANEEHKLIDSVRGLTNKLSSNTTSTEATYSAPNNASVAWNWDAGNTDGKTYTVKVVSDSGNKYRFDDFGTSAVTLSLAEGGTYIFDQSDSSNSGHPLRFSTTSDGTHNSGSEYTTGVTVTGTPGQAGAKTTIIVADSAPTLYYYCSVHSGMGGQADTTTTIGSSNFDGSIQSVSKSNLSGGFSIVSFTGKTYTGNSSTDTGTVGHGLGVAPSFYVVKARNGSSDWICYHSALGNTKYVELNTTNNVTTNTGMWASTSPTDTVFTMGPFWPSNIADGKTMIAYCFAEVEGYSKFGVIVGNYVADGPFVHTGFTPSFIMFKNAERSGTDWTMVDSTRDPYNYVGRALRPNQSNTEDSYTERLDIVSNGFKLRTSDLNYNGPDDNPGIIYFAFASNPFGGDGVSPATAR